MASSTASPISQTSAPESARAGSPQGAIVIGASSGIGAALVRRLAQEGANVAALARRGEELEALARDCAAKGAKGRVFVHVHDTRDTELVPELLETIARELGRVDLAVYAAGVMPKIDKQTYDTNLDLDMLAINFGGCVAWCNALAGLFKSQRSGILIGISSIAGDRGRKPNPMYGATKAAMDHYLEALRNRLSESGVHVCTIKPGYIDTVMTQGMKVFWLISADEAAKRILSAARSGANVRYVPWRWKLVGMALKSVPSFLFRKLNF
ncbi:MAG TPA: SDR family NAD(P)-dependent oxidoreductase [Planctomycetota bacterium]|nr:SDR family NAD(P)-dependent oxidoreductase [Planctomycetota bacterium]